MTTFAVVRWCSTCRDDVTFEQPACLDGHDLDCPDWACVQCGEAVFVGFSAAEPVIAFHPTSHVA